MGEVRPLATEPDQRTVEPPRPRRTPARPRSGPEVPSGFSDDTAGIEDRTGESLYHVRPGIQHRIARRLRRGQIRWRDEIDLHGMTISQAALRLDQFLSQARADGARCVLVIHGKGRSSRPDSGPVLKSMVDRWLRLRSEVLAFCSARPEHGGTGSVYVLLRP